MIYIYDTVIDPMDRNPVFERFGTKFKLEKRHKMGDRIYYSFTSPGMEKILVIPSFISQYREIEKLVTKQCRGKDYEGCRKVLRKLVEIEDEDQYPSELSENKIMNVVLCQYKDIGITFEYENKQIKIAKEFEIRQNNIFGNGQVISLLTEEKED